MEEQAKDLQDYLIAIKKRKNAIIAIIAVIFLLTTLIAIILPSKYTSSATILIEQQDIPPELVMSTVTSFADQRIQTIKARVMTRTNLMKIIEKYNLYEDEREVETTDEIMERMDEDIALDIISADIVDPRTGRPSTATIAFTLSYTGEEPEKVQKVANELASLYLKENQTDRTQKASDTASFFETETQRLSEKISDLEDKLAKFKQENADALPELQTINLQLMQRMESELSQLQAKMDSLRERHTYLSGQLAMMDPGNTSIPGAGDVLKQLEAEYAVAIGKYSPEHPDVIRLKKQIEELKGQGATLDPSAIADQLKQLRTELKQKQQQYTAEHPDVVALKKKIATLEADLQKANEQKAEQSHYQAAPENPAYLNLQSQIQGVEGDMKATQEQAKALSAKLHALQEQLHRAPLVEREYLLLRRDYENAVARYNEMKAKQMQAEVAKQLETESKGERFTLIEPAALPEEPVSPNRPAIIFLGLVLSVGCGFGFAFVADAISGTVRGRKSIENLLGVTPLAIIPYEMNLADIRRKKRVRKRVIILFVLVIVFALLFIHFVISPLDVLWFRVLRKIEVLTA